MEKITTSDIAILIKVIDEAALIIKTQKECIDHLLGKRESFGSSETFGFGIRADKWIEQWEESK